MFLMPTKLDRIHNKWFRGNRHKQFVTITQKHIKMGKEVVVGRARLLIPLFIKFRLKMHSAVTSANFAYKNKFDFGVTLQNFI